MEKILDLDASTIISTGTIERSGYLPRITEEVRGEVVKYGINLSASTYLIDTRSPKFSDFTLTYNDNVVSYYDFDTGVRKFFIEKFAIGKSSHISLCGNPNHPAAVVISEVDSENRYGLCAQVSKQNGDFSLASGFIFYPDDHSQFEPPRDKCLGRTLKKIAELNKEERRYVS